MAEDQGATPPASPKPPSDGEGGAPTSVSEGRLATKNAITVPEAGERPRFDSKSFLATLSELPGVYRMLDKDGRVLYVGKAKNLKRRVSSYFQKTLASPRIALMVSQIAGVDTTVVRSEAEALLLENNLIKTLDPPFNILFRDDKSYPYILLTRQEFPRLGFFRGSPDRKADYFGPFPAASTVRDSIHLLQKTFHLRTCEDSVFANRSRPCLLHQIKRCSGPCVGLIGREEYARDVQLASMFLNGRHHEVIRRLTSAMEKAAEQLAFEQAAMLRDRISGLRRIQDKQYVDSGKDEDVDIVAAVVENGVLCLNLAMVRGGQHLGDKPQFPRNASDCAPAEAIGAFLAQHYEGRPVPQRILVNALPDEEGLAGLEDGNGRPVPVLQPRQGAGRIWVEMAEQNARIAITARQATLTMQGQRQEALREALELPEAPQRIECFDISHTQGEATVASCVVYQSTGMRKSEYRRFNIKDIQPGDDYAAMRQAVLRRYDKVAAGEGVCPDLILIDGGKGQVGAAFSALEELGLSHLPMIGVAKGVERKPGLEQLIFPEGRKSPLQLPPEHPGLHLVQEVRDEAHRFAITGHRARRGKTRKTSRLEDIGGVGPTRRRALLAHFGGLQEIMAASVDRLAQVPGINRELAERIYSALH